MIVDYEIQVHTTGFGMRREGVVDFAQYLNEMIGFVEQAYALQLYQDKAFGKFGLEDWPWGTPNLLMKYEQQYLETTVVR